MFVLNALLASNCLERLKNWIFFLGLQRRRLIPTPLPETATVGRKNNVTGQWVDLPPLPGTLKEPFEIKVYEIDDVERLQRHKREEPEVRRFYNSCDNI